MITDLWWRLSASRAWRIPFTGLGFVIFGAGGLALSLTVFPLLYLTPMQSQVRHRLTRRLISRLFWFYLQLLRGLGLITWELHEVERLRDPNQLIVANHPTLLDVVFLIGLSDGANCVIKGALWRNPFTTLTVRAANYIRNDDPRLFQRCVDALAHGDTLIVFPEGTRSRPGEPLSFQRGPANIALSAGRDFTPVLITCEPPMLLKGQPWYRVPERRGHLTLRGLPTFAVADYLLEGQMQSTAARHLTRDLKAYFEQLLAEARGRQGAQ